LIVASTTSSHPLINNENNIILTKMDQD